jgi:hypothetical protein
VAIKMNGRHLILVICGGCELADLEEVEAKCFHLSQNAVECRPVHKAVEHRVSAMPLRHQRWERGQYFAPRWPWIRVEY